MRLRHKQARPTLIAVAPTLAAATAHATIVVAHAAWVDVVV
jgi:hypothetical protein